MGNLLDKDGKEMQKALNIYQQELSRLHQRALSSASGAVEPDQESNEAAVSPIAKSAEGSEKEDETGEPGDPKKPRLSFPHGLGFPDPELVKSLPSSTAGGLVSPLQQIASITNSLNVTSATTLPFPRPGSQQMMQQKAYKSILPPIHQSQLDRFDSINTEEVVRQVNKQITASLL